MNPFKSSGNVIPKTDHVQSPEEKALVRRLDIFLMTFGCISQVIKYLDQSNINNAYVSGMKEDLGLYGNELNYFTTYFNVAYCIMLIPSQIILTYVRPSFWLPGLEVIWGVITGLMATVSNAKQVYALRAFLGLCESSAWPGMVTLLMYWYTPTELAKRIGFYHSCQAVGSMMSSALQAAITKTMDGHHGLAGWRWLFIVNAIITVVWGIFGIFMMPDLPNNPNPRAFWFKKGDATLAVERLVRTGRLEPKKMTMAGVKRTFSNWIVYFITVLYVSSVLGNYGQNYITLFLKSIKRSDGSQRWSTEEVNVIPIGGYAINVVFVWVWAFLSDIIQNRWILIIVQGFIGLTCCIIMSIWTSHPLSTPLGAAYAGYFLSYTALGTAPLIFSWLSDLLPQDPEARSLIIGVAVASYYAISSWSQVLVWPASQAPYYRYGWQTGLALIVLMMTLTCILQFLDVRYFLPKRMNSYPTLVGQAHKVVDAREDDEEQNQGSSAKKTTD